jgi:hypothetical protein
MLVLTSDTNELMMATVSDRLHLHFSHGLKLALDELCRAQCEGGKECGKETCRSIGQSTQVFCFLKRSNYCKLGCNITCRLLCHSRGQC